jgi:hypothetical protein
MTRADVALQNVHNLYVLQFQLIDALDQDLSDPKKRKEVRESMKQFTELLDVVDHRYMGGEDVLVSLQRLPQELTERLKSSPVAVSRMKSKKKK